MNWTAIGVLITVPGVPLAVWTVISQVRANKRVFEDARERFRQKAFDEGKASAEADLNLLRSERNDARRERDEERTLRLQLEAELRRNRRGNH